MTAPMAIILAALIALSGCAPQTIKIVTIGPHYETVQEIEVVGDTVYLYPR